MLMAAFLRGEFFVGRPGRFTDEANHALPFFVAAASDNNPVVLAAARITAVRRVSFAQDLAITQRIPVAGVYRVIQDRWPQHRALGFKHPRLDELPLSGPLLVFEGGKNTERHGCRAHTIGPGDLAAAFHRRVGVAPEPHNPGIREKLPAPGNPRFQWSR